MRLEWLLRYLLPYEADQGPDEFAEHTGSVAVDVEISAHHYGTEVQSEAAVAPTGDGNVLTDEYMRVALAGGGQRLGKNVVIHPVVFQHTLITLTNPCNAVFEELGFHIDTEIGVVVFLARSVIRGT